MNIPGYKIVLIGDSGVGKSSLVHWFVYERFTLGINPTIGTAFCVKNVIYKEQKIGFQIWDTAGQERFRSMVRIYYKNTFGCLCVFDITDRKSFVNLKYWINDYLEHNQDEHGEIIIVVNKCDKPKSEWCIDEEEIIKIAKEYNSEYIFTSCVDGQGIGDVFDKLGELIIKSKSQSTTNSILNDQNKGTFFELKSKIFSLKIFSRC